MKKVIFIAFCFFSCKDQIIEPDKIKVACECMDGSIIKWDENYLSQTGWTTGNPCWDKGGIKKYIYGN